VRRAAGRLLTGGSELSVSLRKLRRQRRHRFDPGRGEYRKRGQRRGACTLRIGAGGVGLGMVMARMIMARMIMAGVVLQGARRIRVAQHDSQSPINRRQHETCGNERAQAQHRQNEWRRPVAQATGPEPARSSSHPMKVPERHAGIKWGIPVHVARDRRCAWRARCRTPATWIVRVRLAIYPSPDDDGAELTL
jgi:hypothetical protein